MAGREELLHWFKASHRLSSLAARAWPSPWLDASHGFFSLVVAVPVTESKLLVVLTAIKAFAALLLNDVSMGSCFKILGNLNKKNRISFQPNKKRVNAAKLKIVRFTCRYFIGYLLRQYYGNNLTPVYFGGKNLDLKLSPTKIVSSFSDPDPNSIGHCIRNCIRNPDRDPARRKWLPRKTLLLNLQVRYLHSWMSLCCVRKTHEALMI